MYIYMNFVFSVCIRLGYYYDMEVEQEEWENYRLERLKESYQEYVKYKKREREEYDEDMKEIYISIARMFNA